MTKIKCHVSSSIRNFEDRIVKRYGYELVREASDITKPTVFFGMYHIGDYLKLAAHMGERTVFWCGSDILQLSPQWAGFVAYKARHICENEVEVAALKGLGITAEVRPQFFGSVDEFPVCFERGNDVWLSAHPGREEEYGVLELEAAASVLPGLRFHVYGVDGPSRENVVYHGNVSESVLNREVRSYQCAVRLNKFDGFSDVVAKSICLGQYPITRIPYPGIEHAGSFTELVEVLGGLSKRTFPNPKSHLWRKLLAKPLL